MCHSRASRLTSQADTHGPHGETRLAGKIILAPTANPFYPLDGLRPGVVLASVKPRLHVKKGIRIGTNIWYVIPGKQRNSCEVRHGVIQEVGIANRRLTRRRAAQKGFLNSFRSPSP